MDVSVPSFWRGEVMQNGGGETMILPFPLFNQDVMHESLTHSKLIIGVFHLGQKQA